jgi:hypothetical protein
MILTAAVDLTLRLGISGAVPPLSLACIEGLPLYMPLYPISASRGRDRVIVSDVTEMLFMASKD